MKGKSQAASFKEAAPGRVDALICEAKVFGDFVGLLKRFCWENVFLNGFHGLHVGQNLEKPYPSITISMVRPPKGVFLKAGCKNCRIRFCRADMMTQFQCLWPLRKDLLDMFVAVFLDLWNAKVVKGSLKGIRLHVLNNKSTIDIRINRR